MSAIFPLFFPQFNKVFNNFNNFFNNFQKFKKKFWKFSTIFSKSFQQFFKISKFFSFYLLIFLFIVKKIYFAFKFQLKKNFSRSFYRKKFLYFLFYRRKFHRFQISNLRYSFRFSNLTFISNLRYSFLYFCGGADNNFLLYHNFIKISNFRSCITALYFLNLTQPLYSSVPREPC